MTITSQDAIIALFGEFVQLRKTGYDRDEAWQQIEPKARDFASRDLERLYGLLRNWESGEGRQYKPRRDAALDPATTQAHPPHQVEQVQQQSRLKSLIRPLVSKTSLLSKPSSECPACGRPNQTGEVVCLGCGQVLVGSKRAQKMGSTRPMDNPQTANAFFGADSVLYLRLPEVDQPLALRIADNEVVIGRVVEGSVMIPDIDLTPHQGERYGVSRLHVSLKRVGDTLVITDLDSLNHTHVNGQRLHPHEVRVLNDGDEVRLGWMPIRVYFRHKGM